MARIRTIKPEFWTDEKILECSLNGRLLFLGLLNFADDYGNIEGSPKVIKSRILPLDDINIIPLLDELTHHKLIQPYSKNDSNYFHIKGFRDHQRIDKPGKPRCPFHEDSKNIPRKVKESSNNVIGGKGRDGEGKGRERDLKPIERGNDSEIPNSRKNFETAWGAYPEKKGKEKAFSHFKAQVKTEQDYKDLGIAMVNYIADMARVRSNGHPDRAWLHGNTFFNNRWKDYIDYKPPPKKTADGIPAARSMDKDELKAKIYKQMEFVQAEVAEGKCDFGQLMAFTWLHMAVGKIITEFEQRFGEDPLNEQQREFYNDLAAEYKLQDENISGEL